MGYMGEGVKWLRCIEVGYVRESGLEGLYWLE